MGQGTSDTAPSGGHDDPVLRVHRRRDGTVVVDGELDRWSAPTLLDAVAGCAAPQVDLTGVSFIDAAGLRALRGITGLRVVGTSPQVERLVRLSGADRWPAAEPG